MPHHLVVSYHRCFVCRDVIDVTTTAAALYVLSSWAPQNNTEWWRWRWRWWVTSHRWHKRKQNFSFRDSLRFCCCFFALPFQCTYGLLGYCLLFCLTTSSSSNQFPRSHAILLDLVVYTYIHTYTLILIVIRRWFVGNMWAHECERPVDVRSRVVCGKLCRLFIYTPQKYIDFSTIFVCKKYTTMTFISYICIFIRIHIHTLECRLNCYSLDRNIL